jgi:hypothetical protein
VIEGYFLSDFDVQPDIDQGCVFDIGNCVVSLSD